MAITAREVVFRILGNTDDLVQGYNKAADAQKDFEEKTKNANKILGDIAKTSALVVTAVGGLGIALGKMSLDFSKGFAQIEALIPGASARILELKQNVQDMAVAQGRSTEEMTTGLNALIQTFGDSADAAGQLDLASRTAVAGGGQTTDAIRLLAAVTKGYGDTSLAAQKKVADLAFATQKLGDTTIPALAANIQDVVPLSKQLGVSVEEMFNVFATGTGVIGNTSEVATKYKDVLQAIVKPNQDLTDLYQRMGVAGGEALVKQDGLVGGLEKLRDAAQAAGVPFGNLFNSVQGMTLALAFTGAQAGTAADFYGQLKSAAGSLDAAYVATTTGLNKFGFELQQTQAAAQVFGQRLGDQVLKASEDLLVPLKQLVTSLAGLDDATLANIVSLGKVVITVAATAAGVALFTKAILGAGAAWRLLTGLMASNPVGLAIVGVVTLVSVVGELAKASDRATGSSLRHAQAMEQQRDQASALTGQYDSLKDKTNKTFLEQEKMTQIISQLKTLYPELTGKIIDQAVQQGKLKDLIELTNKARSAEAIKNLEADKNRLEEEAKQRRDELNKLNANLGANQERQNDIRSNKVQDTTEGGLATLVTDAEILSVKIDDRTRKLNKAVADLTAVQAKLDELSPSAPIPGASGAINPAGGDGIDSGDSSGVSKTSQGGRLTALDNQYQAERELAKKNGDDLVAIDQSYLAKRKELLESFVKDDVALNKTAQESLVLPLAGWDGSTIEQQLTATVSKIQEIAAKPISTIGFQASVKFQTDHGVSVEEALKSIQTQATRTKDETLTGLNAIAKQQSTLNGLLANSTLTDKQRLTLQDDLANATQRQTKLEQTLADVRHVEQEASKELLSIDLNRISKTSTETETSISKEIELRRTLGLLGNSPEEQQANARKIEAEALQQKQNELIGQYVNLMVSASQATNSNAAADKAKADATKEQIKAIAALLAAAGHTAASSADDAVFRIENTWKTLQSSWDDLFKDGKNKWQNFFQSLAAFASAAADQIKTTFSGISQIAIGLINNQAERDAQESASKLTAIEQQKNAVLAELDAELTAVKKQHAEENEAIAEAEAEADYQAKQQEYDQSITSLQTSLDQETNIAKANQIEKDLEAKRKAKREAQEQKQKDKDDKARAKKQTEEENTILNERAIQEWNFAVQKVNIENQAGDAAAKAAIGRAHWEKASTSISLTLTALEETVKAAASYPDFVGMTIHGSAAILAGINAGVALAAPDPPSYTPQPLPIQPVLLASGGIFLPQPGGTNITTSGGTPAKVAEAGVPEVFLPLTTPNLQTLLQAAGVPPQGGGGFSYAPVFTLQFTQNDGTTKEEVLDFLKNEASRDLMEVVQEAKRQFYLGK